MSGGNSKQLHFMKCNHHFLNYTQDFQEVRLDLRNVTMSFLV